MTNRLPFLVLIGLFFIYLATASGHIASIDGETRFRLTEALATRGDAVIGHPGGGIGHRQSEEGRWYSSMQNDEGEWVPWVLPGASFLAVPFYKLAQVFEFVLTPPSVDYYYRFAFSFLNPVLMAFSGLFLFLLCRELKISPRGALIVTLLFSLGSVAWSFSKSDIDSTVVLLGCLAAFTFSEKGITSNDWRSFVLVGMALGWGAITRQVAVIWIPVLFAYTLLRCLQMKNLSGKRIRRMSFGFVSGLIFPFLLFLWYNHLRFGSALDFGSARLIERVGEQSLFNHDPYWPVWRAALANLLSPGLGLLFHAPALFALPFAFFSARKRFPVYATFAVGMTVIYLVGYSSYGTWDGGGFGPRFMLPVIGVLFPLLGPMIENALQRGQARLIGALTLGLILLQMMLIPIYPPFALERLQDENHHQKMTYFSLAHNQIVTHLRLLPELSLSPLGSPDENTSRQWHNPARQTPDFWWAYLYRYGFGGKFFAVPVLLIGAGAFFLIAARRETKKNL